MKQIFCNPIGRSLKSYKISDCDNKREPVSKTVNANDYGIICLSGELSSTRYALNGDVIKSTHRKCQLAKAVQFIIFIFALKLFFCNKLTQNEKVTHG